MKNTWFENKNCNLLKINKFKSISDHSITHSVSLDDNNTINNFISKISSIPEDGDMMISFGSKVEEINLEFHCENKIQTIEIYGNRFKTPSTGFNSDKNEVEKTLYRDIEALLFPDFNKIIPKVRNLVWQFKDFSITYKGSEFKHFSPDTASINKDNFLITDRNKNTQLVPIISGQLPPQQQMIEINRKKITLLTYKTKDHASLYPNHFQVTK